MKTLVLFLCTASAASADEVELTSGTVIEGKVQDLGDSIKVVKSNGSAIYPKSMVRKITPKKTVEEVYDEKSRELKDDDLDGRLKLARWCLEKKLPKEAVLEFKKVIALNPDHEEARAGAGFQKLNGKWLTEDEANEAKGLVRHKGRWMTPEQRDLDAALEEQKELDKALQAEVSRPVGEPQVLRREEAARSDRRPGQDRRQAQGEGLHRGDPQPEPGGAQVPLRGAGTDEGSRRAPAAGPPVALGRGGGRSAPWRSARSRTSATPTRRSSSCPSSPRSRSAPGSGASTRSRSSRTSASRPRSSRRWRTTSTSRSPSSGTASR